MPSVPAHRTLFVAAMGVAIATAVGGCLGEVGTSDRDATARVPDASEIQDSGASDSFVGVRPDSGADSGSAVMTDSGADAGGVDAGGVDPCRTALFCDDFEAFASGSPPAGPWDVTQNAGDVRVDEQRAFSGMRSVRVHVEGGQFRTAYFGIEGAPVFPVPGHLFWGRMMVWLAAAPTGSIHWTNIQAEGPSRQGNYRALYRYGGQHDKRLMANYETREVRSDCWDHSATVIPEGRWACMEWRFDGGQDEMDFWLDGTAIDDLSVRDRGEGCGGHDTGDNWYGPRFERLWLGWEHYQPTGEVEMWIDDVALGTERLGCPPAL